MVFWKIFHAHSLKDTSQFLLKTTCGPCIFDFTGPNLRYPHVVFCWGQRWWKPLLGTSLVRSQCGGDVGFATSRCIGVSAIRSKVNQPKLQTWLVGEKTHWLHTVTFCLNLIYIYIYRLYIYLLYAISTLIVFLQLYCPHLSPGSSVSFFGGWLSACFPSFTRQQSVYQRTGEEVPPFGCFRK